MHLQECSREVGKAAMLEMQVKTPTQLQKLFALAAINRVLSMMGIPTRRNERGQSAAGQFWLQNPAQLDAKRLNRPGPFAGQILP